MGCVSVASRGATGTDRTVRAVDIVGNDAIPDAPIVAGLANRPPEGFVFRTYQPFDPLSLQVDIDRIVHYYKTQGYFSARVLATRVRELGDRYVAIRFFVDEGAPARIAAVRLEGVTHAQRARIDLARIAGTIRKGRVFDYQAYQQAQRRLQRWFLERGYAHADVAGTVAVDRDANTVVVTLAVQPGPAARFGTTTIQGLEDVPASAVYNRLAWTRGQEFDPDRIERTRARLYELGLFSFVRIDYAHEGAPEVVDMTIHVTEILPHDVRLGGGLAGDPATWELRARASYTQRSFLDPLLTLRVDARPGYAFRRSEGGRAGLGGQAGVTLERADFLAPLLSLRASATFDQTEYELYRSTGPSGQVELYRPFLDNRLLLSARWHIDYLLMNEVPPAVAARADALGLPDDPDAAYRNAFFEQSLVYDRRDSPIDTTEGVYLSLRLEEGGAFAGGAFDYVRATGEARGYVPLGTPRLVLASRLRHGRALYGTLPITRRYFSGGASGHRGFAQRHLSPAVPAEDLLEDGQEWYRVGGEALLETSVEVRWDVWKLWDNWLGVAAFVDGGDVTRAPGDLALGNLQWAVGAGLRYDTPVGPARVDLGYRITDLDPVGPRYDRWAFHLTFGEAF